MMHASDDEANLPSSELRSWCLRSRVTQPRRHDTTVPDSVHAGPLAWTLMPHEAPRAMRKRPLAPRD